MSTSVRICGQTGVKIHPLFTGRPSSIDMPKKQFPEIPIEAKRFKSFRKSLKLTQLELADALGKDQTMIHRYEHGENVIPGRVVNDLVSKFGLSWEWFYKGTGGMKAPKGEKDKSNLLTEIATLRTEYRLMEMRVEKLERDLRILATSIKTVRHE